MNQSISEEFRENFVGGFDAIPEDSLYLPKIEAFLQSKISQAITAERKELMEKIGMLYLRDKEYIQTEHFVDTRKGFQFAIDQVLALIKE